MMEHFLSLMLILCSLFAIIGLSGVIWAFYRRTGWMRRFLLLTGILLLLSSLVGVMTVKILEKGVNQYRRVKTTVKKSYHQLLSTGNKPQNVGRTIGPCTAFYTFAGIENCWRIPLIYPYQIIMQDESNYGTLNQYNGKDSLACPDSYANRLHGIVAAAWCEQCAVFKIRPDRAKEFYQWAILDFDTEKISVFGTETEMFAVLKIRCPESKLEIKPLEWHYQRFERRAGEQKGINDRPDKPTATMAPTSFHEPIAGTPSAQSDPEFFTYEGFRDWWRFPMTYPYQVIMCDAFTYGHLEIYDGKGKIEDGYEVSSGVISNILRLAWNDQYAVFKVQPNWEKRKYQWGTLDFKTAAVRLFDSEEELYAKTKLAKLVLQPLEWHYKQFERRNRSSLKK